MILLNIVGNVLRLISGSLDFAQNFQNVAYVSAEIELRDGYDSVTVASAAFLFAPQTGRRVEHQQPDFK